MTPEEVIRSFERHVEDTLDVLAEHSDGVSEEELREELGNITDEEFHDLTRLMIRSDLMRKVVVSDFIRYVRSG